MIEINSNDCFDKIDLEQINDQIILHDTGFMIGMGCSAYNKEIIEKIFRLQGEKILAENYTILIHSIEQLMEFVDGADEKIYRFLKYYWPGNLTVLLKNNFSKLKHLEIDGKIAFKIPGNKLLRDFLKEIKSPIFSKGINNVSNNIEQIKENYGDQFDLVVSNKKKYNEVEAATIITFNDKNLEIIQQGSIPKIELLQTYLKPIITFICTGNICRSPMAEVIFRAKARENHLNYIVKSAGFIQDGLKISEKSRKVLEENGYQIGHFRSSLVNFKLLEKSWKIIGMTNYHKKELQAKIPELSYKINTYAEISEIPGDIEDPYKQNIEKYRIAFEEILKKNKAFINKLIK